MAQRGNHIDTAVPRQFQDGTTPFPRSQHRKQFQRRADNKKGSCCNNLWKDSPLSHKIFHFLLLIYSITLSFNGILTNIWKYIKVLWNLSKYATSFNWTIVKYFTTIFDQICYKNSQNTKKRNTIKVVIHILILNLRRIIFPSNAKSWWIIKLKSL